MVCMLRRIVDTLHDTVLTARLHSDDTDVIARSRGSHGGAMGDAHAPRHRPTMEQPMAAVLEAPIRTEELARAGRLVARIATTPQEIEAAQRLRWRVFTAEFGARIGGATPGIDRDLFDRFCRHLIVEDSERGEVVGTYRVMLPEQARAAGGLYTEGEFFTDRLRPIRHELVELGRSCVHPDYRTGATIMLLWAGLGEMLAGLPHRYLIGCASVPTADGGGYAASLWNALWPAHAAPEELRVFPKRRLPLEALSLGCDVVVPPLIKGYLRAGGRLIGEPHHDVEFGCADLPMLLALDRIEARYSRRFLRSA
jgi:putative hemolysin